MDKFAVVKTGGKQYLVAEGDLISLEKLKAPKESVVLSEVLLFSDLKDLVLGKPFIPNAKVSAKVINNFKDKKIRVVKFKSKSRYTRTRGHRHIKTKILIEKISI
ncbi:MAG: 50S ribosomal protein L21 [Candidatus Curtissbacteria bacterium GW2011_GWA1_41_11]|uniref:Large ribosomal subunit protein bL21 n=1 Tax=Candidatus Curtissbacteria bacterium GW2011_GWA1_41_11 TaxID=1618409 RepID=A0A0G0UFU0_9BACT|nr:MAG: 50S ribosomal protein L21 [Candidatus Curtissbacteria bacterium GW2011_GWA1_41_11]